MDAFHQWVSRRKREIAWIACLVLGTGLPAAAQPGVSLHNSVLSVTVQPAEGVYEIHSGSLKEAVLIAQVGAEIDHHWVRSGGYAQHHVMESAFTDALGAGHQITVTYSGQPSAPDLICVLRLYDDRPSGDLEVTLQNTIGRTVTVQAIRSVEAAGKQAVNLGASGAVTRVLADSFSEDWPTLKIWDLGQAPEGRHRAAGSLLIYNHESKQSLFIGALNSQRFLTILHLKAEHGASDEPRVVSFTVDSTGTTEFQKDNALKDAPAEDQVELSLSLAAGEKLSSEPVMFEAGENYHAQLEAYGEAIRILRHARVGGRI
jgi:hypothetical protein